MPELRHERDPSEPGWVDRGPAPPQIAGRGRIWQRGDVRVISALEVAEYPDGSGRGPQWHVSISRGGQRPRPRDVKRALRAFGLVGAEEDNHHPGNARHFWRPLDATKRVDCECKATEDTIVEPDGYRWTNPQDPAECRGCEFRRMGGGPCPIHDGEHPDA